MPRDAFLAYLEEAGRESLGQVQARDLAGFWARRQYRGYAPKTNGSLRSCLADFPRHLHQTCQIREDLASRLPPQRYPRRGQTAPYPWTAAEVRLVLDQIDRQSAIGKGDYAMIVLTARLGLRVGDLRCLELGWFDRRAKTLALTQHKTGPPLRLPLPGDVGWAVIDYIRNGRPEAGCSSSTATRSRRLARRRRRAAGAHPTFGVGKDADPLFIGSPHTRLTRWGINKILARHVQSLRRRDPGSAAGVAAV